MRRSTAKSTCSSAFGHCTSLHAPGATLDGIRYRRLNTGAHMASSAARPLAAAAACTRARVSITDGSRGASSGNSAARMAACSSAEGASMGTRASRPPSRSSTAAEPRYAPPAPPPDGLLSLFHWTNQGIGQTSRVPRLYHRQYFEGLMRSPACSAFSRAAPCISQPTMAGRIREINMAGRKEPPGAVVMEAMNWKPGAAVTTCERCERCSARPSRSGTSAASTSGGARFRSSTRSQLPRVTACRVKVFVGQEHPADASRRRAAQHNRQRGTAA